MGYGTVGGNVPEEFVEASSPGTKTSHSRLFSAGGLLHQALSFDLQSAKAYEAAGLTLQKIATQDAAKALELLYTLTPAEKERLSRELAIGWARADPNSTWDWIDSAWVDSSGAYIDRRLQNGLFRETLDIVLEEHEDYQMAAGMLASVVEPDLKLELADLIAFHVVSKNPAEALERMRFQSDDLLDSAIMDAVIEEWAQQDSIGAMEWTLASVTGYQRGSKGNRQGSPAKRCSRWADRLSREFAKPI